ncbi:MAG: hypothetical protein ACE5IB_08035 [Candidatus Geothermarchaeales archaeon]
MDELGIDELREQFNQSRQGVRVLAILSPTCPPCLYGKEVVKELFDEFDSDSLRGFVVWIPMLSEDNVESARFQEETLQDRRFVQGWDPERRIGNLFATTLNLRLTAWDVYLLYASGVKWEGKEPPPPTSWMHQLPQDWGADGKLLLNPDRFFHEVNRLLENSQRV